MQQLRHDFIHSVQALAEREDNDESDNINNQWHENMIKFHNNAIDVTQSITSQHDEESGEEFIFQVSSTR